MQIGTNKWDAETYRKKFEISCSTNNLCKTGHWEAKNCKSMHKGLKSIKGNESVKMQYLHTHQRPDQYKMKILVFSIQYDF